jgi:hypothetical protein
MHSIQELQDGSFIITGEDQNNSSIIYYQKVDENGNEIWVRTYTLEDKKIGFHFVSSMVEPDESVIFLGYSIWETLNKDYVLTPNIVKLDKNGKKIFEKLPIIGKDSTFWPTGILKNEQNQYFIYGEMSSQITDFGDNIALARFDKNFKLEWYNNYERVTSEWPKDAVFISKDTMLLWGFHQRRTNDDNINCLLITADLKEKGLIVDTKNSEKEVLYVNCFPNPSSDQINFQIVRTEDELYNSDIHIFNSFGTLITIIQASKKELTTFDTSQLPNGVYFYSINSINNEESKAFYSGNFVIIHK